ncbi:MAG: GNAT family N-acetyltransferase [Chloroflexota bacterium]|nr:GNAT family N-acetyltransferase [Chloroflexota bacterium]
MTIFIRAARPDEAERLTEIACRSKAHWGYSPERIAAWRPAFLTVTADYIRAHSPVVAVDDDGGVVAFAALEREAQGAVLEHLWVLPGFMGRGIGSRLFRHIAGLASEFTFTSDPQADGFYLQLGARVIGEVESDHQGRTLSLFRYCRSDAKPAE